MLRLRSFVAVVAAVLLPAAACGTGEDPERVAGSSTTATAAAVTVEAEPEAEAAPTLPVTVTGADGVESTVSDVGRIIPVNGDVAEVVFALGLGANVVATDLSATYPPDADALPEIGYQRALVAETVLTYEPTVVVATTDAGPPGVIDELRAVGVPVVMVERPEDLSGPAAKVRSVAAALGVPGRGEALARRIDDELAAAVADVRDIDADDRPKAAFLYLRGDAVQQLAGPGSGVAALLEAAGAVDVGGLLGIDEFAPVTAEALIEARPDVLVVTTTGLASVGGIDGLVALPAFAGTPAARDRRVLAYDDQLVLGLGPRTPEALRALIADLHPNRSRGT